MLPLLVPLALATPLDEVQAAFTHGAPTGIITCAPLGALTGKVDGLPLPPDLQAELAKEPRGNAVWTLLHTGAAVAAGIDVQGGILLTGAPGEGGDHSELDLAFSGTPAQAEALLRVLYDDVKPTTDGWEVTPDHGPEFARLSEGHLRVGGPDADSGAGVPAALQGLPEGPGCMLWFAKLKDPVPENLTMYVPLGGDAPLLLRGELDGVPKLKVGPRRPSPRSQTAPFAVLVSRFPLDSLVTWLAPDTEAQFSELRSLLHLMPGTTVAAFAGEGTPAFVAVVPITGPHGFRVPRSRLQQALAEKMPPAGGFPGVYAFGESGGIFLAAGRSSILVGNNAAQVAEVAAERGQPWYTPALTAWNDEWPVALVADGSALKAPSLRAFAGARVSGRQVELGVRIDDPDGKGAALLSSLLADKFLPNFVEMEHRSQRGEAPATVEAILAAERTYGQTSGGGCLPLPPAPRLPSQVDGAQVAWEASAAWATLGWKPTGKLRGSYQVAQGPDGCTVTGTIDVDHDGKPAVYEMSTTGEGPPRQVTGPDVY